MLGRTSYDLPAATAPAAAGATGRSSGFARAAGSIVDIATSGTATPAELRRRLRLLNICRPFHLQSHHPPVRIGPLAALDADELFAQVVGQRAGFAVADDKAAILVLYLADRGDHCRRAASEALGKSAAARVFLPLGERIPLLLHRQPALAGQCENGVAGHAWQDGTGERRGEQRAVVHHEEDVHAAHLLHPATLHSVQEYHLIAALLVSLPLSGEAGGIIATALRGTCAAGGGTDVIVAHPCRDDGALEIGGHR